MILLYVAQTFTRKSLVQYNSLEYLHKLINQVPLYFNICQHIFANITRFTEEKHYDIITIITSIKYYPSKKSRDFFKKSLTRFYKERIIKKNYGILYIGKNPKI